MLKERPKGTDREDELRRKLFLEACDIGGAIALDKVTARFEKGPNPYDRLPYHNRDHSQVVGSDAAHILATLSSVTDCIGPREIALANLVGRSHDTVQEWDTEQCRDGGMDVVKRKRRIVSNELKSLGETVEFMRRTNILHQDEIFTPEDLTDVTAGFWVTVPCFDCDKMTVTQPNLTPQAPLIARAVALADLGAAGMHGGRRFLETSLALFMEDNLDLVTEPMSRVPKNRQDLIRGRILKWLRDQEAFVIGREGMFEYDIEGLVPAQQDILRGLFNKFEDSRKTVASFAAEAETLSFRELTAMVGY